jgi:hypothetical protein
VSILMDWNLIFIGFSVAKDLGFLLLSV